MNRLAQSVGNVMTNVSNNLPSSSPLTPVDSTPICNKNYFPLNSSDTMDFTGFQEEFTAFFLGVTNAADNKIPEGEIEIATIFSPPPPGFSSY